MFGRTEHFSAASRRLSGCCVGWLAWGRAVWQEPGRVCWLDAGSPENMDVDVRGLLAGGHAVVAEAAQSAGAAPAGEVRLEFAESAGHGHQLLGGEVTDADDVLDRKHEGVRFGHLSARTKDPGPVGAPELLSQSRSGFAAVTADAWGAGGRTSLGDRTASRNAA